MTIEGETTRPIYTQNSSMYQLMKDGVNNTSTVSTSLANERDPRTFPIISKDKKTLWIFEVDGRQGWYSWVPDLSENHIHSDRKQCQHESYSGFVWDELHSLLDVHSYGSAGRVEE